MKWSIKYRTLKNPKIFEETIEGFRDAAVCKIYLRHCQNRLKGCPSNTILKIESISEVK